MQLEITRRKFIAAVAAVSAAAGAPAVTQYLKGDLSSESFFDSSFSRLNKNAIYKALADINKNWYPGDDVTLAEAQARALKKAVNVEGADFQNTISHVWPEGSFFTEFKGLYSSGVPISETRKLFAALGLKNNVQALESSYLRGAVRLLPVASEDGCAIDLRMSIPISECAPFDIDNFLGQNLKQGLEMTYRDEKIKAHLPFWTLGGTISVSKGETPLKKISIPSMQVPTKVDWPGTPPKDSKGNEIPIDVSYRKNNFYHEINLGKVNVGERITITSSIYLSPAFALRMYSYDEQLLEENKTEVAWIRTEDGFIPAAFAEDPALMGSVEALLTGLEESKVKYDGQREAIRRLLNKPLAQIQQSNKGEIPPDQRWNGRMPNLALLDLWDMTCAPCIKDQPNLARFAENTPEVQVLCLCSGVEPQHWQNIASVTKANPSLTYGIIEKESWGQLNPLGVTPLKLLVFNGKVVWLSNQSGQEPPKPLIKKILQGELKLNPATIQDIL